MFVIALRIHTVYTFDLGIIYIQFYLFSLQLLYLTFISPSFHSLLDDSSRWRPLVAESA
jgi:hypothetical protein